MHNKLTAYSGAAIAFIAMGKEARSQIIYTDISPDSVFVADPDADFDAIGAGFGGYDGYHLMYFDVDADGANDFRLKVWGYTYYYTSGGPGNSVIASGVFASASALVPNFGFAGGMDSGPFLCCTPAFYNYYSLSKFQQGDVISSGDQWTHGGWGTGGDAALFFSHYINDGLFGTTSTNGGLWNDVEINNGYLAFRKKMGANYRYGWVRLSVNHIPVTPGVLGSKYFELTVHDYAINTTTNDPLYAGEGLPECVVPVTFDAAGITAATAKLKWSPVYAADSYQIYFRPVGAGAWQKINATTNQKKLTGLLCNTNYEWKVRTKCDGMNTAFSPVEIFTTASCRLTNDAAEVDVTIFPNPASNQITIDVSDIPAISYEVYISDLTGNQLSSVSADPDNDLLLINVSQLPAGVYFINLSWGENRQTFKFVKQ